MVFLIVFVLRNSDLGFIKIQSDKWTFFIFCDLLKVDCFCTRDLPCLDMLAVALSMFVSKDGKS